ncbi:MAG: hypothetical protein U0163_17150 [Gemmatimonadaceae bacterium]
MSFETWWSRFTKRGPAARQGFDVTKLPMADWHFVDQEASSTFWRDAAGDVISLTPTGLPMPALSNPIELQQSSREFSEGQRAGLVEVTVREGIQGSCLTFIYKRLEHLAFKFCGVAQAPGRTGSWLWMVVCNEHGTTGIREAIVTARMIKSGRLTVDSYRTSWARDPYEPAYDGVEASTLRYLSDDVEYDVEFPDHPLTKSRRELDRLIRIQLP